MRTSTFTERLIRTPLAYAAGYGCLAQRELRSPNQQANQRGAGAMSATVKTEATSSLPGCSSSRELKRVDVCIFKHKTKPDGFAGELA